GATGIVVIDVVVHRNGAPAVRYLHERRDDEGHEIRGARQILAPGDAVHAARQWAVGHQPAVRDHRVLPRHGGHELPGHLVVGEVVRREPEMIVVVLTLTPDLLGSMRLTLGPNERQALS